MRGRICDNALMMRRYRNQLRIERGGDFRCDCVLQGEEAVGISIETLSPYLSARARIDELDGEGQQRVIARRALYASCPTRSPRAPTAVC